MFRDTKWILVWVSELLYYQIVPTLIFSIFQYSKAFSWKLPTGSWGTPNNTTVLIPEYRYSKIDRSWVLILFLRYDSEEDCQEHNFKTKQHLLNDVLRMTKYRSSLPIKCLSFNNMPFISVLDRTKIFASYFQHHSIDADHPDLDHCQTVNHYNKCFVTLDSRRLSGDRSWNDRWTGKNGICLTFHRFGTILWN